MVFTVAVVSLAAGAVTEFQFRIGHVRAAADGTAMGIRCLGLGDAGLIGTGIGEGHHLRLFGSTSLFSQALRIDPPAHGQDIQHIFAKEQEIVSKRNDREQIIRERIALST